MRLNNNFGLGLFASLVSVMSIGPASAQQPKPNILVIMADDIGYWNISAYNRGMMGYRTPNIDRIANEGALITDYYGQQSCTAGALRLLRAKVPCVPACSKLACLERKKDYLTRILRLPTCSSL